MIARARRLLIAFAALNLLGVGVLAGQLGVIHVSTHDAAQERQRSLSGGSTALLARRGDVLDRHGRPLARCEPQVQLQVWPPNLLKRGGAWRPSAEVAAEVDAIVGFLAPRLDRDPGDLAADLLGSRNAPLGPPLTDPALLAEVEQEAGGLLRPLDLVPGWRRSYPAGTVAGNVIGFVDHAGHGVAGIERQLDALLSGADGARFHRRDAAGRAIHHPEDEVVAPLDGCDLRLTLDLGLQDLVERRLAGAVAEQDAEGACAVLLDVSDGGLLALASVPLFDAADRSVREKDRYRHRALESIYAPGSTFKPLMMAAALDLGLVVPNERIDCRAEQGRFGNRALVVDTKPQDQPLRPEEILIHSSNIGMARILTRIVEGGDRRDVSRMAPVRDVLVRLGLGSRTGLPLPWEAPGKITDLPEWRWEYTLVSVSYGYELSVSAVQMAAAVGALSDGRRRVPRLVAAVRGADGAWVDAAVAPPVPVFSRRSADMVRDWMVEAATHGSAEAGLVEGVLVAGKTGTAYDETDHGREIHSFVALFPADAPRFALVVLLEDPQGGRFSSRTTAPAARSIVADVLRYTGLAR